MVQHSPRYQPPLQNEEEKLPFDTKWGYRKNVLFQQCLICVNVFTKFDCVYFTLFKLIQFVHWNKRYMLVRWLALGPQYHVAIAYAVCYSFHIISSRISLVCTLARCFAGRRVALCLAYARLMRIVRRVDRGIKWLENNSTFVVVTYMRLLSLLHGRDFARSPSTSSSAIVHII